MEYTIPKSGRLVEDLKKNQKDLGRSVIFIIKTTETLKLFFQAIIYLLNHSVTNHCTDNLQHTNCCPVLSFHNLHQY